jgi:transketolase
VERAAAGVPRGGYVLRDEGGDRPDIVLIGTGSEVQVCLGAADLLAGEGFDARVVSLPSWDLLALQGDAYLAELLPPGVPRLSVEAASSFGWDRYADAFVAIDHFGASAPGEKNMEEFGFTAEHVAARANELLADRPPA